MRRSLFLLCVVVWWAFHGQPLCGQNAAPVQVTIQLPVPVAGRLIEEVRLALAKAIVDVPIVPQGPPRVLKGEIVIPRVDAAKLVVKGKDDPWHDSDSEDGGRVLDRNEQGAVIQAQGGPAEANPDDFVTLDELTEELGDAIAEDGTAAGALLLRALLHATERRLEPALADVDRLVAMHPRRTEFLLYRSMLCQHLDRMEDAERDLNRAIELEPNSIHALARRSNYLTSQGKLDGAIRDLNASLKIDAKCYQALTRRAEIKRDLKQYDDALDDANAALRLEAMYWPALVVRAKIYASLSKYDLALNDYNAVIAAIPKPNARLYIERAPIHFAMDHRSDALKDAEEAVRLDESCGKALLLCGELRLLCGDKVGGKSDFLQAARMWDLGVRESVLLAERLSEMGESDAAAKVYARAGSLPAKTAAEFTARADARHHTRDYSLAIEDCSAVLEIDPKDAAVRIRRTLLFFGLGDYERSQADIQFLMSDDPNSVPLLRLRAQCWHFRNQPERAIADYTRVIEQNPTDVESLVARGGLYRQCGQFAKAIDDLGAAVRAGGDCIPAYRHLVSIWASCPVKDLRNGEAAVGTAKTLVARPNAEPVDLVLLAAAYAECGEFEEAVKYQEMALAAKKDDRRFQASEKGRLELYRSKKPYHEPLPVN